MRDDELRDVLAVRAIEKADRDGAMLPPADRAAASREARRAGENTSPEKLLAARARLLLPKVIARHSFVGAMLQGATGPAALGWALVVAGALVGFGMSVVDDHRRINVLVPVGVLGIVGWNLLVYALLVVQGIRGRSGLSWVPKWFLRGWSAVLARKAAESATFHAPLGQAMARFAREWFDAADALLLARAARVFHLGAAAAGIGLIAGIYLRGLVLDYHAGWESTFLDGSVARTLLAVAYGPASLLTGIAIPDVPAIEAMRWKGGVGGVPAASWLHLLGATIVLFVVLPRLALALGMTARIARMARALPVPASLALDARDAFGAAALVGGGAVEAIAYAYEPAQRSRAGLRTLLVRAYGEGITVDVRSAVRYGEEEDFVARLASASPPDVCALVFSLASTPEDENHGILLAGVRDWVARAEGRARLLVIVDEAPYAARMSNEARLGERRDAWRKFVAAHGPQACCIDLAAENPGAGVECVRESLWPRS